MTSTLRNTRMTDPPIRPAYADIYSYWTMVRLRTASLLGLASEPQLKQRSSELARPSQLPPSASPELRPMVLLPRELHTERTI